MTQEEKAKAYDEAIERAKKVLLDCTPEERKVVEYISPELKESEDEKMMNQLHSWMKEFGGAEEYTEKVYQWIKGLLEKQGEHANFLNKIQVGDKVTRNQDGMLVNLSQLNRVAKKDEKQGKNNMGISEATKQKLEDNLHKALEKETPESWNEFLDEQGEHKPWSEEDEDILNTIINHFKVDIGCTDEDDMVRWLKSLKERVIPQPNQEWSKEDKETLSDIITSMTNLKDSATSDALRDIYNSKIDWLKSLKDRVQPKPNLEWSEEDEKLINDTCHLINTLASGYGEKLTEPISFAGVHQINSIKMRLRALVDSRPQNTWKPSELQIEALESATENCAYSEYQNCLRELAGQLKKLREE